MISTVAVGSVLFGEMMFSGSFRVLSICLRHRCILMRYQACSSTPSHTSSNTDFNSFEKEPSLADEAAARAEAYRQLENLDFQSAAMILSTTPPKRKKFGLDFHLVQLFFTLLPSLAVYLVAQYARSEIRKMKAEAEKKRKKAEEEDKAKKDAESASAKEEWSNELSEVKVRLVELEEAVKVIVDEKKKKLAHSDPNSAQNATSSEKADPITDKAQNDTMQLKDKAKNDAVQHNDKAQNDTVQHKDKAQNGIIQHKDASVNPAG